MSVRVDEAEPERAHRVFKQFKSGMRDFEELTVEEVGLLAIYYTFLFRGDCE